MREGDGERGVKARDKGERGRSSKARSRVPLVKVIGQGQPILQNARSSVVIPSCCSQRLPKSLSNRCSALLQKEVVSGPDPNTLQAVHNNCCSSYCHDEEKREQHMCCPTLLKMLLQ